MCLWRRFHFTWLCQASSIYISLTSRCISTLSAGLIILSMSHVHQHHKRVWCSFELQAGYDVELEIFWVWSFRWRKQRCVWINGKTSSNLFWRIDWFVAEETRILTSASGRSARTHQFKAITLNHHQPNSNNWLKQIAEIRMQPPIAIK